MSRRFPLQFAIILLVGRFYRTVPLSAHWLGSLVLPVVAPAIVAVGIAWNEIDLACGELIESVSPQTARFAQRCPKVRGGPESGVLR